MGLGNDLFGWIPGIRTTAQQKAWEQQQAASDSLNNLDNQGIMDTAGTDAYERTWGTGPRAAPGETLSAAQGLSANIPTFTDWMAQQGNQLGSIESDQSGMRGLIDRLSNPEADIGNSQEYAAQMLGIDNFADYQTRVGDMLTSIEGGIGAQQGLTPEEMAMRQKQVRRNSAEMERRASRVVNDSLADSGSMARMFAQADETLNMMADKEIAQQIQISSDDAQRKMLNLQAKQQQWGQMVQAGTMASTQYMQNVQAGLGAALQGYSLSINATLAQNAQYESQFTADRDTLRAHADAMFNAAQLQAGLVQQELDTQVQLYASALLPYQDQMNAANDAAERAGDGGDFFGAVLGIGAIIGGAVMMTIPGLQIPGGALLAGGVTLTGDSL